MSCVSVSANIVSLAETRFLCGKPQHHGDLKEGATGKGLRTLLRRFNSQYKLALASIIRMQALRGMIYP
jgi:hypothetical protein